jgi:hypothetical protein
MNGNERRMERRLRLSAIFMAVGLAIEDTSARISYIHVRWGHMPSRGIRDLSIFSCVTRRSNFARGRPTQAIAQFLRLKTSEEYRSSSSRQKRIVQEV